MSRLAAGFEACQRSCARALGRARRWERQARVPVPGWDPWMRTQGWALAPVSLEFPNAYKLIPSIQFCITLLAETIASYPLRWYARDRNHQLLEIEPAPDNVAGVWRTGNPDDTGYELVEKLVTSLLLHGNAYIFKAYADRRLFGLWALPPLKVRPAAGPDRSISGYQYNSGGRWLDLPKEQVLHVRRMDPEFGLEGVSPLAAVQMQYETEYDRARFGRFFFSHGGTVSGFYSTEQPLDPDEREDLEKKLKHRYQGPENAWDPVILPKSLKWERGGLTMREMEFVESHKLTLSDVLMIYKIPVALAGILEGTGMNSDVLRTAMFQLHEFAAKPLCTRIVFAINEKLLGFKAFLPIEEAAFDYSGVLPFQEAWLDQAKAYMAATGGPVMTRNEARGRLTLPKLDDPELDALLLPVSVLPGGSEPAPAMPAAGRAGPLELTRRRDARALSRHEARFQRGMRRIFRRQRAVAQRELAKHGSAARLSVIDLDQAFRDPRDRRELFQLIRALVFERGEAALDQLGLAAAFEADAAEVALFIHQRSADAITAINQTTRAALRDALAEGTAKSEGVQELAKRVDEVFNGRDRNSLTIARTETTGGYNFANVAAWNQSGVVGQKRWLTAGDEVVRPDHAEAEGQIVDLDEPFDIGGEQLDFPGDPEGSAGQVVNCRCTMVPELIQATEPEEVVGEVLGEELPHALASRLNGKAGELATSAVTAVRRN